MCNINGVWKTTPRERQITIFRGNTDNTNLVLTTDSNGSITLPRLSNNHYGYGITTVYPSVSYFHSNTYTFTQDTTLYVIVFPVRAGMTSKTVEINCRKGTVTTITGYKLSGSAITTSLKNDGSGPFIMVNDEYYSGAISPGTVYTVDCTETTNIKLCGYATGANVLGLQYAYCPSTGDEPQFK